MPPSVEVAPAKLTVSLRVTGVRADGYHLVDAEMVTLDLADELRFQDALGAAAGLDVVLEGAAVTGLPVPADDDNLVARALRHVDREGTVRVEVRKRIPAGAGLGGGSADAAAVLRWAGRTSPQDVRDAVRLGADVAFCVLGGRARVTGIGEVVEPLPFVERTYTVLIPPFGVSTPAVYAAWDRLGGPRGPGPNDLEQAALAVEPRLAQWRDRLASATSARPVLAGSGSAWFVEGAYPGEGRIVARTTPPMR